MDFRKIFYSIFIFLGLSVYSSQAMVTAVHVDQVRQLTAQGKLPGSVSDYNGIQPDQLANRVVEVISKSQSFIKRKVLPKFLGGTSSDLLNGDLTKIIPEAIRDEVKIQYWIRNGMVLSQEPIGNIHVFERNINLLMQRGLIPGHPVLIGVNLRDIARYYVDNYSQFGLLRECKTAVFGGWSVANKQHKITSSLKYLPLDFQNDVKRYYHCKMLRENEDVWLNNEKINIPASYFVEYEILPLPIGVDLNRLKDLERNNQIVEEARLYATFIRDLDNPGLNLNNRVGIFKGLVVAVKYFLPTDFRDKIIEQYAILTNMSGRLICDQKAFGAYDWEISLGQLLDMPGMINAINQELAVSHTLNLLTKKVKSVMVTDFNRINFGDVKELIISSKVNIKDLPSNLRTCLPNLQKLEIIYN
ncbi:MAG: hypothetical protein WC192_04800 [Candidatus Babeliales bacterium]|jgi:hypothetical protein